MKKTIWYISKYATPWKDGSISRHFCFAGEFARLGYETLIITSDSNHTAKFPEFSDRYTREFVDGVQAIWIKTRKYSGSGGIGRVLSWLDFEWKLFLLDKKGFPRPDTIIISSLSLLTILNGLWLKRSFKSRLIFEVRDIWPLTMMDIGGYGRWNPLVLVLTLIERLGYRKSDAIVGTMPNIKEHVENIIGLNDKCFCVPQGIDISLYEDSEPLESGYVDKYIPKGKFIVGYAGSIGRSNALEALISCAYNLRHEKGIHFLLIGEGDKVEDFKQSISGFGNISFAPKVRRRQVQEVLGYCDVLYDSTQSVGLYKYGLSRNKWIDYMYAGKPIVVSYSGYPSMIDEAKCGCFVPAGDVDALVAEIQRLRNLGSEERHRIGMRGRDWVLTNRPYSVLARRYISILFPEASRKIS